MPRLRPKTLTLLALALAGFTLAGTAAAPAPPAAPAAFDPLAATNAYLASVAGPERARSDAYFEGGTHLWDRAAATVICGEAGVRVGGPTGGPSRDSMTVAANAALYGPLCRLLEEVGVTP